MTMIRQERQPKEKDYLCGVGNYRPQWLQKFSSTICFTIIYVIFGISQGAMKAYLNGSITTIEKKFGLTGKMFGIILIADNITGVFASLLLGYYAYRVSRPKMIFIGIWIAVASCFLYTLPHILYGSTIGVHTNENGKLETKIEKEHCSFNQTAAEAAAEAKQFSVDGSVAIPVCIILFIANMLGGIGGSAFYIAGTTYTDDNVKKSKTPMYLSIMMGARLVGPLCGYVTAAVCLKIYQFPAVSTSLTPRDPRWIGAWWLGFVIWGVVMAVISIPIMLFPRNIRREQPKSKLKPSELITKQNRDNMTVWQKMQLDAKDFLQACKRLLKNPVFMWKMIAIVFIINGIGGYVTMFPKYVEHQYRVSASSASLLTGPTKIVAMIVGVIFGGAIIQIFKPNARTICYIDIFTDVVNVAVLFAAIFLGCGSWQLGGTTFEQNGRIDLTTLCNADCHCTTNSYHPICDLTTNISYFSPCFAGCLPVTGNETQQCQCMGRSEFMDFDHTANSEFDGLSSFVGNLTAANIKSGFCPNNCNNLYILVVMMSIGKLLGQIPRVGEWLIALRCIDPADKAMAMGFAGFFYNILGAIPYPLIYGAIFDNSCLIWGEGSRGNCWFYDLDKLRYTFHGVTLMFYSLGVLCFCIMAYYAGSIKNMYDADEDCAADAEYCKMSEKAPTVQEETATEADKESEEEDDIPETSKFGIDPEDCAT